LPHWLCGLVTGGIALKLKELKMRRDEIFPSKYLRAADLTESRTVTVTSAALEVFKNDGRDQTKLVLTFRERDVKPWICNMTCYDILAGFLTDETDSWRGARIELYPDRTRFGNKLVDCIRCRQPSQAALPMNSNGAAARLRPVANPKPPQPAPEPPPADDYYDDTVPFK
jgi:hypothetical protein